jgi:hypothetical protein
MGGGTFRSDRETSGWRDRPKTVFSRAFGNSTPGAPERVTVQDGRDSTDASLEQNLSKIIAASPFAQSNPGFRRKELALFP